MGKGLEDFDGVLPERDLLFEDGELDARKKRQSIEVDAIDRDIKPSALFDPGQKLLADRVIGLS